MTLFFVSFRKTTEAIYQSTSDSNTVHCDPLRRSKIMKMLLGNANSIHPSSTYYLMNSDSHALFPNFVNVPSEQLLGMSPIPTLKLARW